MRIISWNVNGLRSVSGKLKDGSKTGNLTNNVIKMLIEEQRPDILCFQECKTQNPADLEFMRSNYKYIFTNFSKHKKGYSGVALLSNEKPQWVSYGFQMYSEDEIGDYNSYDFIHEGRIITAKFEKYVIITTYVPNAQPELARLEHRLKWEEILRNYLRMLKHDMKVPIILCGDLNVAPEEIDIHNPKGKKKEPGFSDEERAEFKKLVEIGFTDTFRYLYSNKVKYTYWSNFANARYKNLGWRIDMVMISKEAENKLVTADCLTEYFGSDHAPIIAEFSM